MRLLPARPFARLALLALLILAAGCGGDDPGTRGGGRAAARDAEAVAAVTLAYYTAMDEHDTNAYLDAVLPEDRRTLPPDKLLDLVAAAAGMTGYTFGLDLSELGEVQYADEKVTPMRIDGDYALVMVEGGARLMFVGMEFPFCALHDLRRQGDQWYIDIDAPEAQPRMAELSREWEEKFAAAEAELSRSTSGSTDSAADLFSMFSEMASGIFDGVDILFDQCPASIAP